MKKLTVSLAVTFALFTASAFASPLMEQRAGTGADADKWFCKYGDGEVIVIYASRNCPVSN